MEQCVQPLEELGLGDVQKCGGKAAGLGELLRLGLSVPPGFCILGDALDGLIEANGLADGIGELADGLDFDDYDGVEERTGRIRALIEGAEIPGELEAAILGGLAKLAIGENRFVAVRSSVAVRDSEISSFPGMMDTYHYVLGQADVLARIRECWASLWTTRAAFARHQKQIPHDKGVIAPIVQLMVRSEVAGVLFTAHPVTKEASEMVIESNWGLGESVVSGKSMNDFFVLDKETLAVKQRQIAAKTVMVVLDDGKGSDRTEKPVPEDRAKAPTLNEDQLARLGAAAKRIEAHFGYNADMEWAFQDDTLFILQARPIRGLED